LLSIILRNSFDIYKMLGMAILFLFCIIHWLVNKRSEYLVSRGSREVAQHLKMLILSNVLLFLCFIISYVFYKEFIVAELEYSKTGEERLGKIYVIIGFEFVRLFIKGVQHNFKY